MDGDDGGDGDGEAVPVEHRRHSSAPILMHKAGGGDFSTRTAPTSEAPPPRTKGGKTTEDDVGGIIGSSASAGRQDSTASGASTSSSGFRRRFLICPAPRMYSREAMADGDDDEDEMFDDVVLSDDIDNDDDAGNGVAAVSGGSETDPDSDLKSLLGDVEDVAAPTTGSTHQEDYEEHGREQVGGEEVEEEVEHDVKPTARMLPLHLIRPTIGQNLAKIDACGCRLNVFDLGGLPKMRPLWDRYYAEVDAVVFVVDARTVAGAGGSRGISRLEETVQAFDLVRGQDALDGVPLMVFVNKVDRGEGGRLVSEDDDRYQTQEEDGDNDTAGDCDEFHPSRLDLDVLSNALNLYGHPSKGPDDDLVVMTAGSARTGEGVRAAFEWLVLKARNVQREMDRIDRKMTM